MAISRLTCVPDTSVLIDLAVGDLMDEFFKLQLDCLAPDLILAELREEGGQSFVVRGLQEVDLPGKQMQELYALRMQYPQISVADTSALVLARALSAILLAGDGHLRKAAQAQGVRVHGILWILDQLVHAQVIAEIQAAERLRCMLSAGSRLPHQACNERLERWGMVRYYPQRKYNIGS